MPHFALPLRYHPLRRSRPDWGAIGTEWCTSSGTIFLGHPEVELLFRLDGKAAAADIAPARIDGNS